MPSPVGTRNITTNASARRNSGYGSASLTKRSVETSTTQSTSALFQTSQITASSEQQELLNFVNNVKQQVSNKETKTDAERDVQRECLRKIESFEEKIQNNNLDIFETIPLNNHNTLSKNFYKFLLAGNTLRTGGIKPEDFHNEAKKITNDFFKALIPELSATDARNEYIKGLEYFIKNSSNETTQNYQDLVANYGVIFEKLKEFTTKMSLNTNPAVHTHFSVIAKNPVLFFLILDSTIFTFLWPLNSGSINESTFILFSFTSAIGALFRLFNSSEYLPFKLFHEKSYQENKLACHFEVFNFIKEAVIAWAASPAPNIFYDAITNNSQNTENLGYLFAANVMFNNLLLASYAGSSATNSYNEKKLGEYLTNPNTIKMLLGIVTLVSLFCIVLPQDGYNAIGNVYTHQPMTERQNAAVITAMVVSVLQMLVTAAALGVDSLKNNINISPEDFISTLMDAFMCAETDETPEITEDSAVKHTTESVNDEDSKCNHYVLSNGDGQKEDASIVETKANNRNNTHTSSVSSHSDPLLNENTSLNDMD